MKPIPQKTADGEVYEVFAKFKMDDPMHHVGSVVAPDPELAVFYASSLYNEWTWSEMIIVPRTQIVTVIPTK